MLNTSLIGNLQYCSTLLQASVTTWEKTLTLKFPDVFRKWNKQNSKQAFTTRKNSTCAIIIKRLILIRRPDCSRSVVNRAVKWLANKHISIRTKILDKSMRTACLCYRIFFFLQPTLKQTDENTIIEVLRVKLLEQNWFEEAEYSMT